MQLLFYRQLRQAKTCYFEIFTNCTYLVNPEVNKGELA